MKKNVFLLLAACVLSMGQALACNVLTVSDVNVPQGGEATLEIGCEFDTEYTAFELQLSLPEGLSLLTDEDGYPVVERAFDTNHILTGNLLPSNGNYKITCRSMENQSMPTSGALLRVTVLADASLSLGTSLNAAVTACEFTRTADSEGDNLDDVPFTVSITEFRTILDENSTTEPEAEANANVRVKRTIAAGEWGTIVLPFAMTEEQVKTAFGNDVELGDFTGISTTYADEDETEVSTIKVNFSAVNAIEANHPYIIKVTSPVTEFTADGVDIDPEEQPSTDCDELRLGSGTKKDPYRYLYNSFVGTYTAGFSLADLFDEGSYPLFLSGGQFWYAGSATQPMKAFRAYFDFYDVLASVENAQARIKMTFQDEDGLTGIDAPKSQTSNLNPVFDLQGRRVAHPGRGLYIRGGKIVNIK